MYTSLKKSFIWLPVIFFFVFYLVWLSRAYFDVAYMDTINIMAGNMNNMYNNDTSIQDYYYRSPFLLFFSLVFTFINCKLFFYNSYYENILSGVVLLLIAIYYIRSGTGFFNGKYKVYFSILAGLIIFCLTKWEMSLWGGGYSHYMVVLAGFICMDLAHKYYIGQQFNSFGNRYFIGIYTFLSVIAILEATSYFLPFQLSILILLLFNFRLFKDKINVKRWRVVLGATILMLAFSIFINSLAESYSARHQYEPYGKVNLSHNVGASFKKITEEPQFVTKFFLIANAGNLVDKDSYANGSFGKNIIPVAGIIILLFYGAAIFLFIKKRKIEGVNSINLIVYTLIFYAIVLMGRMHFGDVYYGGSSRYAAATFSGILGVATFFLLFLNQGNKISRTRTILFSIPLAFIVIGSLIVNKNQWQIAPYRMEAYTKMADNLRANENLESLMGYNKEITEKAREMMIRNKLNVFKPKTKLDKYRIDSGFSGLKTSGFYDSENDQHGAFRWTDGDAVIYLPNLYNTKDTFKLRLQCYVPQPDTPRIVLNDRLVPFNTQQVENGYEYSFSVQEQKVLFRIFIQNTPFIPAELDEKSTDKRKLGIIFNALSFRE